MTAVGSPLATSAAKVGPDSTPMGEEGKAAAAASLIRQPVASSIPLAHSTTGVPGRSKGARLVQAVRRCCAGVTSMIASAPATSARSAVISSAGGSGMPGR